MKRDQACGKASGIEQKAPVLCSTGAFAYPPTFNLKSRLALEQPAGLK